MSLLQRLFGKSQDDHAQVRPLWHKVVALARDPAWYAEGGLADTVPGRFDAITMVLALVFLRMEQAPALRIPSARLTELFVSDMDGQLRESGVGDPVMSKHMGRLMSALGGRIDAYRTAMAQPDDAAVIAAIERNMTLGEAAKPARIAADMRALTARLAMLSDQALLSGEITG